MAKYEDGMYHKGSSDGAINIHNNLITCEDNLLILSKIQSYVLNCYHKYILRPLMNPMEVMICQHFYWIGIRNAVQKEVTNCDTCQHTKQSNKKYGKLQAKLAEEIPWNRICVDINGLSVIGRTVTMIDPVT